MAAQRASAKSKKPAEAAKDVAAEQVPDGFVVVKQTDEEGNLNVSFSPIGNCQVTEAVTILGMAYAGAKRQVGLE